MNVEFWKKHQDTPLEEAKAKLRKSHKDVMALLELFSNDELFAKRALAWTGTSPLGILLRFGNCQPLRLGDEEDKDAYQNI